MLTKDHVIKGKLFAVLANLTTKAVMIARPPAKPKHASATLDLCTLSPQPDSIILEWRGGYHIFIAWTTIVISSAVESPLNTSLWFGSEDWLCYPGSFSSAFQNSHIYQTNTHRSKVKVQIHEQPQQSNGNHRKFSHHVWIGRSYSKATLWSDMNVSFRYVRSGRRGTVDVINQAHTILTQAIPQHSFQLFPRLVY